MTKLHQLAELGQAIWLDYIRRSLITSGELRRLVDDGLRGMTFNPTIFEAAMAGGEEYGEQRRDLVGAGKSSNEIFEALAIKDIQDAADEFRRVYDQTDGLDGYVSLEVNPHLASDTQGTMEEARRLFQRVNWPNVVTEIPAIEQLISEGTISTSP